MAPASGFGQHGGQIKTQQGEPMRARGMLFAAVMLAVPAAQTAPAPPCDDCKYQRCLDSEISRATRMSAMYDRVGKSTQTMDAYKTGTDTEGNRILGEVQAALGDNPDCKTKIPDLTQMPEQRRWQGLGWSIEFKDNVPQGVGYSAATKIDGGKCVLRESQLDKLKEMLPCLAIGNATEAHERNHVARCENKNIGVPTTPAQMGAFEVEGYKAELKVLRDAKDKLDRKCRRRASSSEPDTGERYAQRERLRRALSRVSSYAATI
jgi:hypothetical protein